MSFDGEQLHVFWADPEKNAVALYRFCGRRRIWDHWRTLPMVAPERLAERAFPRRIEVSVDGCGIWNVRIDDGIVRTDRAGAQHLANTLVDPRLFEGRCCHVSGRC